MQVILLEKLEKLGTMGDVVHVKDGYGRNFLLPSGKALRANKENLKRFEAQRADLEKKYQQKLEQAQTSFEAIDNKTFTLIRQASEGGQLYGSVNSRDIVALLAQDKQTITPSQVILAEMIKTLGIHEVRLRLHPEIIAKIKLNVARSEEDASGQLTALTDEEQQTSLAQATQSLFEEGAAPTLETSLPETSAINDPDPDSATSKEKEKERVNSGDN